MKKFESDPKKKKQKKFEEKGFRYNLERDKHKILIFLFYHSLSPKILCLSFSKLHKMSIFLFINNISLSHWQEKGLIFNRKVHR